MLRHCHTWCPEAGTWRWLDILWLSFGWVLLYVLFFILWLMQFCWAEKKKDLQSRTAALPCGSFCLPFPAQKPESSSERWSDRKQWVLSHLSVPAASFWYDFTEIQAASSWGQRGQLPVCLAQLPTFTGKLVEDDPAFLISPTSLIL